MIPTEGKMRKVHHAVSLALRLKRTKNKRADSLKLLKDQYMLDNEQTCVVWHAADLIRQNEDRYNSYDDAIREAREAGVEIEVISGKHDRLTDPNNPQTKKTETKKAEPKETKQKEKPKKETPKKAETKKQPKQKAQETTDDALFSFE